MDFLSMMGFRETVISKIVKDLIETENRDDPAVQAEICKRAGIPIQDLLSYEIEEIGERVSNALF